MRSCARVLTALTICMAACISAYAQGQPYPTKPIKIVVPFAAGGSTDILARMTAETLSNALKQTVIVENKAGASGNIGMDAVSRASPDGYTLLFTSTNLTLNSAVITKTPFDPVRDFAGITMLAYAPLLLITQPDFGGHSLNSLIKYGIDNPNKLNFSSSGAGGAPHLAGEMLQIVTGIKMTHVPYGGAAQAITDIASGQVQMTFTTYLSAQAFVNSGRLRALAVTSEKRLSVLPNVPTFTELGYKNMEFGTMFGLLAPAGTKNEIVDRLYEAIRQTSANDAFKEKIELQGASMVINTPAEFNKYILNDVSKWDILIRKIGNISKN